MLSSILSVVIVINELMASNVGSVMSPAYNFDSWIELYNPTEQPVNLSGMYLSDDAYNLKRWKLPSGIGAVPAKGFLVVWLGSDEIRSDQAPFKLDSDGGVICLSDRDGQLVTSVEYPKALSRTSWARTIDGGDNWGWTADATPGATNATSVFATKRLASPVVSEGSRILNGPLTVKVEIPEGTTLMYTTDGSVPESSQVADDDTSQPSWKNWVRNSDCEGSDASCFVCRDGDGGGDVGRITDGVGFNGSRGAMVHAIENPANDWDSQFFVYTPDHLWNAGDRYRFRMKMRADKPCHVSVQSHHTPGDYIHWQMLDGGYNITTEWQQIDFEGTISDTQAGSSGMQTIAFNLNESAMENNFYFDDIVWEEYTDASTGNNASRQSKDGLFTVTQTTNYVFRLFRDGYLPSVPVTRSYIQTNNEYSIPVISIVGDERYFTDPMWGIDVKGTNGISGNGRDDEVNWNQPWDRSVNFSYISPTDGMLFNQDVNISVSGGWSRMSNPRSMKLKSSKLFDGQNHLDYAFFPQKPNIRSKALLVRNGGNDSNCRFMDPALTTIVQRSGIDLDVQSTVQVVEYINGRFKGVLNLREPNNDKYVYSNYGYDDEEIDMFENGTFRNGTDEVYRHLCEISENVNAEGVYDEVKTLLDIDEFTNYIVAEVFLGNDDWPDNNVKAYRSQNDGRFRFILFDLDQPFNAWGRNFSQLDQFGNIAMVRLFRNLLQHDEYRKKFIDTFCILGGSVFEKTRATAIVDELADAMRPMLALDGRSPDGSANNIKGKLANRLETMMGQLQQYRPLQLSNVKKVSLQVDADTEGANIFINNIDVPYADFNGQLFAPVCLEAKAPAGYTFTGWRKSSGHFVHVFDYKATWRYYDSGEAAAGWQSPGFNQASWKSGAAPLGYNMSGVRTTVSYGDNPDRKHPTTYFRKTFTIDADPKSSDLFQLNYQVDDGCIIWVNGQEAGRVNMRQGNVNYDTFSSTYAPEIPLEGTLDLNPLLFKKGSNVVAVEVHNTSYTSSDLYWDCELLTTVGANTDDEILTESVIDLSGESNVALTACFTPLTEAERRAEGITPVCINEVSAANDIYVNEFFNHNDWVELYNTSSADIDIVGMYLSNDPENPRKYQIGQTNDIPTVIPAHGFLTIWCDKLEPLSQLHASFKLDADGGEILLTAADESWSDHVIYAAMKGDETVGRYPDGCRDVFTMNVPTMGKANIMGSYSIPVAQPAVNDIRELVTLRQGSSQIYNLQGQAVGGNLPPGIYIKNGRKFIKR
ncbi:MAG: lamin tail domain-containing protein [Prevotella sp.]|nr:lamin tail domain-containing protein [Prevotella sp.]